MGRGRNPCLLLVAIAACGGPLDRRDGALVIRLENAPASAETAEISVYAAGRTFKAVVPRPPDDRITELSAIPIGHAVVDVRLRERELAIASAVDLEVEILENATQEVVALFGQGPE